MTTGPDLLDEYARALRGSWGDIDGRSEQSALNTLSDAIRTHGTGDLPDVTVQGLRTTLDVCPSGLNHWTMFCDEECEVAHDRA